MKQLRTLCSFLTRILIVASTIAVIGSVSSHAAIDGISIFNRGDFAQSELPLKEMAANGDRTAKFLYCKLLPQLIPTSEPRSIDVPKICSPLAYVDEFEGEYFVGDHLTQKREEAFFWLSLPSQNDNVYARWMLASLEFPYLNEHSLINSLGSEGLENIEKMGGNLSKFKRAEELYLRIARLLELPAEKGIKSANGDLGLLYMYGAGVETDIEKARNYFDRADDTTHIEILKQLDPHFSVIENELVRKGEGSSNWMEVNAAADVLIRAGEKQRYKDEKLTATYFARAAPLLEKLLPMLSTEPRLVADLKFQLSEIYFQMGTDNSSAPKWERYLRESAEMGDRDAKYKLSLLMQFEDPKAGRKLLLDAAELGHIEAESVVAQIYCEEGAMTDCYSWHERAANQGNGSSQIAIGLMNLNGIGVVQNFEEAYFWLSIASVNQRLKERIDSNNAVRVDRTFAREARDRVSKRLTDSRLIQLQEKAQNFRPIFVTKFD